MFYGIFGLILGSFLCLCAYRIPLGITILEPKSFCDSCERPLYAYECIPVVSWIYFRKCRKCNTKIPIQSTLIEILCGLYCWIMQPAFESLLLFSILLLISLIDIKTMMIYDRFHIMLLLLGLGIMQPYNFTSHFITIFLIGLPLFLLSLLTNGIGMGDVKLYFTLGFILGFHKIMMIFTLSVFIGCLWTIPYKKKRNLAIPFVPSISLACIIVWHYHLELQMLHKLMHALF